MTTSPLHQFCATISHMSQFVCSSCGYVSASWYGKCPECKEWSTLKQFSEGKKNKRGGVVKAASFAPLNTVSTQKNSRIPTTVGECDRVLGGGFIHGEVVLIAGEPGVGKSTLLLKMLHNLNTIYVSGEESGEQIKQRADRLSIDLSRIHVSTDIEIQSIISGLQSSDINCDVVVIDSIQTMYSQSLDAPLGSTSHIKEVTSRLVEYAKTSGKVVVIVGHVTKEGDIAGPKTLEHLVDCVLYLEGERHSHYRLLRVQKNRFGPTDEVGIFEMRQEGLVEIAKPSDLIDSTTSHEAGRSLVVSIEGSRALFYEIQSLVVPTVLPVPRRVVSGIDFNRLQLLLAVMRKHMGISLDTSDIYVSVVGGLTAKTPAADLGIVASIASSIGNSVLPEKTAFIGEIGLLGEIRGIYGQKKIIQDSERFGLDKIYSSEDVSSVKYLKKLIVKNGKS